MRFATSLEAVQVHAAGRLPGLWQEIVLEADFSGGHRVLSARRGSDAGLVHEGHPPQLAKVWGNGSARRSALEMELDVADVGVQQHEGQIIDMLSPLRGKFVLQALQVVASELEVVLQDR